MDFFGFGCMDLSRKVQSGNTTTSTLVFKKTGLKGKPTDLKKEDKILRNIKMTVHEPDRL